MSNIIPIVSDSPPPMDDSNFGWNDDDDDADDGFGTFSRAPTAAGFGFPQSESDNSLSAASDVPLPDHHAWSPPPSDKPDSDKVNVQKPDGSAESHGGAEFEDFASFQSNTQVENDNDKFDAFQSSKEGGDEDFAKFESGPTENEDFGTFQSTDNAEMNEFANFKSDNSKDDLKSDSISLGDENVSQSSLTKVNNESVHSNASSAIDSGIFGSEQDPNLVASQRSDEGQLDLSASDDDKLSDTIKAGDNEPSGEDPSSDFNVEGDDKPDTSVCDKELSENKTESNEVEDNNWCDFSSAPSGSQGKDVGGGSPPVTSDLDSGSVETTVSGEIDTAVLRDPGCERVMQRDRSVDSDGFVHDSLEFSSLDEISDYERIQRESELDVYVELSGEADSDLKQMIDDFDDFRKSKDSSEYMVYSTVQNDQNIVSQEICDKDDFQISEDSVVQNGKENWNTECSTDTKFQSVKSDEDEESLEKETDEFDSGNPDWKKKVSVEEIAPITFRTSDSNVGAGEDDEFQFQQKPPAALNEEEDAFGEFGSAPGAASVDADDDFGDFGDAGSGDTGWADFGSAPAPAETDADDFDDFAGFEGANTVSSVTEPTPPVVPQVGDLFSFLFITILHLARK